MDGYYENLRDSLKYPSCWKTTNDACFAHFHSSIEIVYVTEGELEFTLNGHSSVAQKDQIFLVPSYTVHYYATPRSSKSIVLTIPLDFVPSFRKLLQHKTFRESIWQEPEGQRELLGWMEKLVTVCPKQEIWPPDLFSKTLNPTKTRDVLNAVPVEMTELSQLFAKGYLYSLLAILSENLGLTEVKEKNDASTMRDILRYLDANYRSDVTLDTLAARFGYSKSRFSHLFHAYFGCGIPEYVNTLRCRNAAFLLTQESISLTDAALTSGFESMRTFYRSFKRTFGVSPGDYRTDGPEPVSPKA